MCARCRRGRAWWRRFRIVHGSPLDEDEYVLDAADASQVFAYAPSALEFFGHTHVQGGFIWRRGRVEDRQARGRADRSCSSSTRTRPTWSTPARWGSRAMATRARPSSSTTRPAASCSTAGVPYDVKKAQEKIRPRRAAAAAGATGWRWGDNAWMWRTSVDRPASDRSPAGPGAPESRAGASTSTSTARPRRTPTAS